MGEAWVPGSQSSGILKGLEALQALRVTMRSTFAALSPFTRPLDVLHSGMKILDSQLLCPFLTVSDLEL